MNMFKLSIALGIAALYMQAASAYEIQTHGNLSEAAYDQSVLNKDTQLLQNLGLKISDAFPNSENPRPRTIKELISDGARFEDNSPRPVNHFFDPVNNKALFIDGKERGQKSPDWALEDAGLLSDQAFSYRDARDYLYKALTEPNKADREKNFGLTFQTLGQVIHHLQDMAQPQHVRNDPHCDRWYCALVGLYSPSRYEKYTDEHRGSFPSLPSYAPVYSDSDPTTFNTPRKLWATGTGAGMAEFST